MADEPTYWPGQIPRLVFSLRQLRAIASSSRSSVFWAYSNHVPYSTSDIGQALGRSSQSVRYHTNELIKVGLLIPVETRKRKARTEVAYVTAGVECCTADPPLSAPYLLEKRRGFQALWRQFDRDRAAVNMVENLVPEKGAVSRLKILCPRLTRDQLARFQVEVSELMDRYGALDTPEGVLTRLVSFSCPTVGETAREYFELTGKPLRLEGDAEDDE